MATLTNTQISVTYVGLLKTSGNTILDSTPQQITDGSGNNSQLFLSTTKVGVGATPSGSDTLQITGTSSFSSHITLADNAELRIGTSTDLKLFHDGFDTYLQNETGNLTIRNKADDKDIIFQSDDGSGGVTTYFFLDGSLTTTAPRTIFPDNSVLGFGTGADLQLYHDGSNSVIQNLTGNLTIQNTADDSDVIFRSDDGSGGTTEYFRLDGGEKKNIISVDTRLIDNKYALFGTSNDLHIGHTGTDSVIDNFTGDLYISNKADDKDIIFRSDDGSGGFTTYFFLDGSSTQVKYDVNLKIHDNKKLIVGDADDLQIFHDGHSRMENNAGDFVIQTNLDDGDIKFRADDGSGGIAEYFRVDGGSENVLFSKILQLSDSVELRIGDGNDLRIKHDGTDTFVENENGDFYIRNKADDKDIIFQSDDGSGGVETYFFLDGNAGGTNPITIFPDSSYLKFGSSQDLSIVHSGSGSEISHNGTGNLVIQNQNDDADIIFKSDDGSGGVTEYFKLDGGTGYSIASKDIYLIDDVRLRAGTSGDFSFFHDGSNSKINNNTGNIVVENFQDDGDISFKSDDGSGGTTEYMRIDGGQEKTLFIKNTEHQDGIRAQFGGSGDFSILHDGTNAFLINDTGNLTIQNNTDDGDIIFKSDDGSGGTTEYFRVDGGENRIVYSQDGRHLDNVKSMYGSGADLQIVHDGTLSSITNVTGDLYIQNSADDQDIIFRSDDGSGGVAEYFKLDGSNPTVVFSKSSIHTDNIAAYFGTGLDFQIVHNATNTEVVNATGNLNIKNSATNGDISFFADDGGGGVTEYFRLDGGLASGGELKTLFPDNSRIVFGDGADFNFYHDGTDSRIQNTTGHIRIINFADDSDIIFSSDDGSGGTTEYFRLDGSTEQNVVSKNMRFEDSIQAQFGAGTDLRIYHDSSDSYISDTGTGGLYIKGSNFVTIQSAGGENMIKAIADGSVELYHDNTKKFETASGGVNVNSGNLLFDLGYGVRFSDANTRIYTNSETPEDLIIEADQDLLLTPDGSVELYENSVKKFETTSSGVDVTGRMDINDGNNNVLVGDAAGDALSAGSGNVAIGYQALSSEDGHGTNIAVGHNSLATLNAGTDAYNIAIGYNAGMGMTTGTGNNLIGGLSGDSLTTGVNNNVFGYNALGATTDGIGNVAIGHSALEDQNDGVHYNTAIGYQAGKNITTGNTTVLIGAFTGDALTTGNTNTAVGYAALSTETAGDRNVGVGYQALKNQNNTSDTDAYNVAVGYNAGVAITTGDQNTIIGGLAGDSLLTGTNNIIIGYNAEASTTGAADEITLGNANNDTIRAAVQTISSLSDERDKTNIQESTYGLDFIDKLNPVTFDWNTRDGSRKGKKDLGFIAQELDAVDDEYTQLVYKSNPDKLEASYGRLVPVLVKAIQELKAEIELLKK